MKALRNVLDKVHPLFAKGGILEVAYPMYEALDTFLYTPGEVASGKTHVRDGIDLKRMMITVVAALISTPKVCKKLEDEDKYQWVVSKGEHEFVYGHD